jgi:hypothetical protein
MCKQRPRGDDREAGMRRRSAGLIPHLLVLLSGLCMSFTSASAQTKELTFELKVEHGTVPPGMRLIHVTQGDRVKLRWTSDRPITLHLHGYDIERTVMPGAIEEMVFTASATGRFPVEEHKSDGKSAHAHGDVPVVRIEVYPR